MSNHYPFELQPLPYAYDSLEPYIDIETMHFHHDKHLQTYVDNLNKALAPLPQLHDKTLEEILTNPESLPEDSRIPILNNAGGVYNHQLYFNQMIGSPSNPGGNLKNAIEKDFGSLETWQQKMKEAALAVFGSGYAWLVADPQKNLLILKTPNQDSPLALGYLPILLVDVWEHAYYLKNQNRRAEYLDNWFHVIDWKVAGERFSRN